jgi:hypothetical protein
VREADSSTQNVWILDWEANGKEEILDTVFARIFLFKKAADHKCWGTMVTWRNMEIVRRKSVVYRA